MHTTPAPQALTPLLSVRAISKRFGAVPALDGVDLDFHAGEIHAVLGENGAGKSTLMRVLAGLDQPDAGTILLDGRLATFPSPRAARHAGIGMVHQHFTLVEALTVAENLALSVPQQSRWRFDATATAAQAAAFARRIGFDLSAPDTPVFQLPVGARQRIEVLKALAGAGRVLILDEPTAVLTPQEVRPLFAMLRHLRAENRAVIFITHKLREVKDVADRVSIMRRGRVVGTYGVTDLSESEMAERMVGGELQPRRQVQRRRKAGDVILRVTDLGAHDERGVPALVDVRFEVRAGELFGIAGVDGNGQRELFDVLVGVRSPATGSVRVGDQSLTTYTPRAALEAGICHIPPDRQRQGLVLPMSVEENFLLSRGILDRFSRHGVLQREAARRFAAELAARYAIRFAALDAPVRSLSGGNQQRIVVARELALQPRVLITVNPTRGLDVVAALAVTDALSTVAREGCAVVLISTDLDEVLDLSDRVSVLYRGRLSHPLDPPIDIDQLGLLMAGAAA